ncbi:MAG: recombination mediator RecR [Planctomycetota bacterium]
MVSRSRAVERLIALLGEFPGIGPKTSERLAYHVLQSEPRFARDLAAAIVGARESTKVCSQCFQLDETDPCAICSDPARERSRVLVVEDPRDVAAFEAAGYRGLYHILQGRISALDGIRPEDLTLAALTARIAKGEIREVCLATNPDLEGEGTANLIAERLAGKTVTVTRIARGIPAGSTITQVSSAILADAIEGRRPLS